MNESWAEKLIEQTDKVGAKTKALWQKLPDEVSSFLILLCIFYLWLLYGKSIASDHETAIFLSIYGLPFSALLFLGRTKQLAEKEDELEVIWKERCEAKQEVQRLKEELEELQ